MNPPEALLLRIVGEWCGIGKQGSTPDHNLSVAHEIESDWRVINNQAEREALDHMKRMGSIEGPFYLDPNGYAVVGAFLEHARGWKGTVADRIKKELRRMCEHPRP